MDFEQLQTPLERSKLRFVCDSMFTTMLVCLTYGSLKYQINGTTSPLDSLHPCQGVGEWVMVP